MTPGDGVTAASKADAGRGGDAAVTASHREPADTPGRLPTRIPGPRLGAAARHPLAWRRARRRQWAVTRRRRSVPPGQCSRLMWKWTPARRRRCSSGCQASRGRIRWAGLGLPARATGSGYRLGLPARATSSGYRLGLPARATGSGYRLGLPARATKATPSRAGRARATSRRRVPRRGTPWWPLVVGRFCPPPELALPRVGAPSGGGGGHLDEVVLEGLP